MTDAPRLRWVPGAPAAESGEEVVGLEGLLAGRLRRARWTGMPGAAVDEGRGIRWPRREQRDSTWWPQGIDLRSTPAGLVLAISWHHPVDEIDTAARVTFIDLRGGRHPRFAHVRLVELVDGSLRPVAIHAGGIAWYGDLLHVADTFGGLRVFDVRDIVRRRARWWRSDYLLVQSGSYDAVNPEGLRRMRYSFISLEHDAAGPRLVAGEYRTAADEDARLLRIPLGSGTAAVDLHAPGIARMQGACVVDETWYITTSNGPHHGGDLLVGRPDALVRHPGVLPPGPEDLAHEPGSSRLWSVTEHPGQRWVYAINPGALPA